MTSNVTQLQNRNKPSVSKKGGRMDFCIEFDVPQNIQLSLFPDFGPISYDTKKIFIKATYKMTLRWKEAIEFEVFHGSGSLAGLKELFLLKYPINPGSVELEEFLAEYLSAHREKRGIQLIYRNQQVARDNEERQTLKPYMYWKEKKKNRFP